MTIKKIYTCDICRVEIETPGQSFGLCFSGMQTFTLGGYGCTDETHICYDCARQLYIQLNTDGVKQCLGVSRRPNCIPVQKKGI